MAQTPNVMNQISPQHQDILKDTWSQLLGAEGGSTQNLAADLLKNLVSSIGQSGGQSQGGSGDLLGGLGGLASQFLGGGAGRPPQQQGTGQDVNEGNNQQQQGGNFGGGSDAGEDNNIWKQLGVAAGQYLGTNRGGNANPQGGNADFQGGNANPQGGNQQPAAGGGNFLDQFGGLGNIAGMVEKSGLFNQAGGGGGGNLMGALGGLGSLAALAGSLKDPSSLLQFFLKSPVAQTASDPENSSRDIYKVIKNAIFGLLGSKLPADQFQENPEAKSAWKGYLGLIANALRNYSAR